MPRRGARSSGCRRAHEAAGSCAWPRRSLARSSQKGMKKLQKRTGKPLFYPKSTRKTGGFCGFFQKVFSYRNPLLPKVGSWVDFRRFSIPSQKVPPWYRYIPCVFLGVWNEHQCWNHGFATGWHQLAPQAADRLGAGPGFPVCALGHPKVPCFGGFLLLKTASSTRELLPLDHEKPRV